MSEPFAVHIYRQYLRGKTVPQLVAEYGIPVKRIEQRLKVAAQYAAANHLEGATAISSSGQLTARCSGCGVPLDEGLVCEQCQTFFENFQEG